MTRADRIFLLVMAYLALTAVCSAGAWYQGIQDGHAFRPLPQFVPMSAVATFAFRGSFGGVMP